MHINCAVYHMLLNILIWNTSIITRSNTHKIPWVSPEKLYCMIISRVSAVLGSIVADAASLPLEWIYKDSTMKVAALKGVFAKK